MEIQVEKFIKNAELSYVYSYKYTIPYKQVFIKRIPLHFFLPVFL
jgi:hypothetical protein